MPVQLPAIDKNAYTEWLPEDRQLYNRLPYYLVKYTARDRQYKGTWLNLFENIDFQKNSGEQLKFVWHNRTPIRRQFVRPNPLFSIPLMDVNRPLEKTVLGNLYRHRFVSQHFTWSANFTEFMRDRIEVNRRDIAHQMIVFEDEFYRTQVWDTAPYVYLAGYGLVNAPATKDNAWLQSVLPNVSTHLELKEVFKLLAIAETDIGVPPWSGSVFDTNQTSRPLDNRYLIVGGNEVWNAFIDDPWVKENRPLNLDLITGMLRGDLWGRARFKPEYMPIHILANETTYAPSFPEPEKVDETGADTIRPKPNPDYAKNAQYAISWFVGAPGYRKVNTDPPAPFSTFGDTPLDWNGAIRLTDKFLVPYLDENNNIKYDMNSWGEFLRFQSELALGMIAPEPHTIIPIIHKRKRFITTVT